MKRIITFEERGGTNDHPSPAKIATNEANRWVMQHHAEILHMTAAISVNHEQGLEDYTLTLEVKLPEDI